MKDNVFSMFGGGTKKDKVQEDEPDEPSGSAKAKKDAEGDDGVSDPPRVAVHASRFHPGTCPTWSYTLGYMTRIVLKIFLVIG